MTSYFFLTLYGIGVGFLLGQLSDLVFLLLWRYIRRRRRRNLHVYVEEQWPAYIP